MLDAMFHPDFRTEPYWWDAAPPEDAREAPLPATVDLLIVGSGFAGLSAALEAARGGATVAVVDGGPLGGGASSRSGGMVSSGQKLVLTEALAGLPAAEREAALHDSQETFEFLKDLVAREALDADLQLCGRFFGAFAPAHLATLRRNAATLHERTGVTVRVLSRAEQRVEVGSDYFHGGFVVEDYGGVHPAKLNRALRQAARAAGATLHSHARVLGTERKGEGHLVRTERGDVRARNVLYATNGYTDRASPWLHRRVVPVMSYQIATEPLPAETMDRLIPHRRMVTDSRKELTYIRPSPDGTRLLLGCRPRALPASSLVQARRMRARMLRIFPELEPIRLLPFDATDRNNSMSSASKVSRRLTQAIAPEVVDLIYRPRLAGELAVTFPLLCALNEAHLVMLARQRIVTPPVAAVLAEALLRVSGEGADAIEADPLLEDAYFNVEARIIALAGPDAGGRLHIARSRNDLSAALDRLRLRALLLDLLDGAAALRRSVLDRAELFVATVMPGYTHLQPAQPITFGYYLSGIASALERDAARLHDAWSRLNLSPMGAAALATTAFPIDRNLVARLLGFDAVLEHGLDCVASRDFSFEVTAAAAQLALTLSRLAADLHVFVSHEFSAVEFPDSVCGTSSIMPQKKNPVVLEHLKGKASHVLASLVSMGTCVRASHFTNTLDAHREGQAMVWTGLVEAGRALELARIAVSNVQPNAALLLHRARANHSTATELADLLVRAGTFDFRTAHHVAGAVVRKLMDTGLGAHQGTLATVDEAAQDVAGHPSGLTAEAVAAALDPERAVAARTVTGGTAPGEVSRMIERMRTRLAADGAATQARRDGVDRAERQRLEGLRALLQHT